MMHTARIRVWMGGAGTGKTARLLDLYRQQLGPRRGSKSALWLSPTIHARRAVLEQLPTAECPVIFQPQVSTFEGFAERVLRQSLASNQALSSTARRLLLRRVVGSATARGRLKHFGPIAGTPGFLDLVESLIAELKREEVWPERFAEAAEQVGRRAGWSELIALYGDYQQLLNARNWYDGEGRFWHARQLLEEQTAELERQYGLVVVDGFSDFTQTQFDILRVLARAVGGLEITLPAEPDPERQELFAQPLRTLERLRSELGSDFSWQVEHCPFAGDGWQAGLQQVARSLFRSPRRIVPKADAAGLQILVGVGPRAEQDSVAWRIKELLRRGVAPGRIVVICRDLATSGLAWFEKLQDAGIPVAADLGIPLLQQPVLKALCAVLRLCRDDWSYAALMSVLRSSLFQPRLPHLTAASGPRIASVLRRLDLEAGRDETLQVLGREALHHDAGGEVADAHQSLSAFAEILDLLRGNLTLSEWVDQIAVVAERFGWIRDDDQEENPTSGRPTSQHADLARKRLQAREDWQKLQSVLRDAAAAEELLAPNADAPGRALRESVSAMVRRLSVREFLDELRDLLRNERRPLGATGEGRVWLMTPEQVRHLTFDYVFFVELVEESFPRGRRDHGLLSESDRERLREGGVRLSPASERLNAEMLLFYRTLLAGRRGITLSYAEVNSSGQRVFPSPYLTAVQDLFLPGALVTDHEGGLDPLPRADRLLSTTDVRLDAMSRALHGDGGLQARVLSDPLTRPAGLGVLAALEAAAARFETEGFTRYEGLSTGLGNPQKHAARYSANHQFSAKELQLYADCPFRFWGEAVLGLQPIEAPESDADSLARGNEIHELLSRIESWHDIDALAQQVAELLAQRPEPAGGATRLKHVLHELDEDWLQKVSQNVIDHARAFLEAMQPHFQKSWTTLTELEFGQMRHIATPSTSDTAVSSTPQTPPLQIGPPASPVLVRGRIDRVDISTADDQPTRFLVIDYKSGKAPPFDAEKLAQGNALQLALYVLAVLRLDLAGRGAEPLQAGYWALAHRGFAAAIKQVARSKPLVPATTDLISQIVATIDELIPRLVDSLRSGHFTVSPRLPGSKCKTYCPLKYACRIGQVEQVHERLHKEGRVFLSIAGDEESGENNGDDE